ncbi:MAG: hypothetical protein HFI07_02465 [Lachnospiraceae bacterium]|nr:hypothetical protein [Lachnospiraceae bacterium]
MSAYAENSTLSEKGRSRGGGLDRTVGIWAGEDEITEAENVRARSAEIIGMMARKHCPMMRNRKKNGNISTAI